MNTELPSKLSLLTSKIDGKLLINPFLNKYACLIVFKCGYVTIYKFIYAFYPV